MLEFLAGIIAGSISGLGMGGGTVLILVLANFVGLEQHIAQATNLVFYIPTAITAIIVNVKQKLINFRLAIITILSGILGTVIGSELAMNIDASNLKKYFGMFLFLISLNEIFWIFREYILKKKRNNKSDNINNGGI